MGYWVRKKTNYKACDFRSEKQGKLVFGPFPADGFFAAGTHSKYEEYWLCITIRVWYFQSIALRRALILRPACHFPNFTRSWNGLWIAGKNQRVEGSLREAIYQAVEILKHRSEPSKEITLVKRSNLQFTRRLALFFNII